MPNKVRLNITMDERWIKEAKRLSDLELRSMSNYLEWLIQKDSENRKEVEEPKKPHKRKK